MFQKNWSNSTLEEATDLGASVTAGEEVVGELEGGSEEEGGVSLEEREDLEMVGRIFRGTTDKCVYRRVNLMLFFNIPC